MPTFNGPSTEQRRADAITELRERRFSGDAEFLDLITAVRGAMEQLANHPRLQHPMMPLTPEWKAAIDAGAEARTQEFAAQAFAFEPDRRAALRHALEMVRAHLSGEVVDP